MKKFYAALLITFCLSAPTVFAQEEKIQSDRPGESQTAAPTGKGYLQAEIGFRREQQNKTDYSVLYPRAQIKYGLSKRFELRAEFTEEKDQLRSENEYKEGLEPVELGLKAKLLEQKGILPALSFYTQVGIPNWASKAHQKAHLFPKMRLLLENKLTDKFKITYNGGAEWPGEGGAAKWLYTIQPEIELSDKWEAFLETFAYLQRGEAAKHSLGGGLAFYPVRNLKLDLWGGKGLSKEAHFYFVSAGVSFRLKT